MSKFKVVYQQLMCQLNKQIKPLIFQEVYVQQIFKKFIKHMFHNYFDHNGVLKYTYNDFKQFFESWKVSKYFDKNKILYVVFCDKFQNQCQINITDDQLIYLKNRFENDLGLFISGFQNQKNIGLLLLKDPLFMRKQQNICIHQLIHFIQWETGMTIHDFLKKKQFDISESDINQISKILEVDESVIRDIIKNVIVPDELEAYTNTIFYDLKNICKQKSKNFNRFLIRQVCQIFQNYNFSSFRQYYLNVEKQLNEIKFQELLNTNSFIFLLLLGYFKKGYNAFKNHIFTYFDKDEENKK